jgi:hypothetical protein
MIATSPQTVAQQQSPMLLARNGSTTKSKFLDKTLAANSTGNWKKSSLIAFHFDDINIFQDAPV